MCLAIKDVLSKTGIPANEIKSVGFSGQMHGLVALDGSGNNYPLSMVKAGTMLATVLQNGVGQMTAGINAAIALSKGEAIEKEYGVPFVLVTAENVDDYYTGE